MAGYLLSGSAVKKVSRVVKKDATTPLRGRVQGSRRIGGQGGRVSDDHPWKMSLFKKDGEETQYCKVGSGIVNTNVINEVPEGLVNLSTYGDGDTVYIYARIANNWQVGGSLNSYPTLTVLTGANDTNFAGNNVRFPASDFGYYFLPIGEIEVEKIPETSPIEYTYTIEQIETNNVSIDELELKAFKLASFFVAKTSDTATDTSYKLFCMEGQAQTPDASDNLPETSTTVSISGSKYAYLNITCSKDASSGGYTGFSSSVNFTAGAQGSTDTNINYLIGRINNGNILQSQEGNFLSPARIW